jgi:hypothetical protein
MLNGRDEKNRSRMFEKLQPSLPNVEATIGESNFQPGMVI